jgi:hypothetical protein
MLPRQVRLIMLVVAVAATPQGVHAQSEVWVLDTPDGFQRMGGAPTLGPYSSLRECEGVRSSEGGFQNNPQARCRQVSSSSSTSNTGRVISPGYDWRQDLAQTAVTSFLDGWRRGRAMARQRAAMEEQRRQTDLVAGRVRAAQEAARREEERRQRELAFQRGKAALRELMGLPQTVELGGLRRDEASSTELGGLRRGEISEPPAPRLRIGRPSEIAQPTGGARLDCSVAIAILAAGSALADNLDEGVYLARQSRNALVGDGLEVQCPPGVPGIEAVKCTVRRDGQDVPVPCDEAPLSRFYDDVLESTSQAIDRLSAVRQEFPDLARAKRDAADAVREKAEALERARIEEARRPPPTPTPAPVPTPGPVTLPRTRPCSTELCRQAQRELEEAREREQEVDEAMADESESRSSLQRNVDVLRQIRSNPSGVSSALRAGIPANRPP